MPAMAPASDVPSFDSIIQAGRERTKNEALANEIFGRGRNSSTSFGPGKQRPGTGPSLASRIGVKKLASHSPIARKPSTPITPKTQPSTEARWYSDPKPSQTLKVNAGPNGVAKASNFTRGRDRNRSREDRLLELAETNGQSKSASDDQAVETNGSGIIIRGLAGPYVVMASNFAPGTTSADIESAMIPIGGEMQSCRIMASSPTVIAEMVFVDKKGADAVIETFNNQKADGRLLHVFSKSGPPTGLSKSPTPALTTMAGPFSAPLPKTTSAQSIAGALSPASNTTRNADHYASERERADRNRRLAEPQIQDGRFGFAEKEDTMDVDMDEAPVATIDPPRTSEPRVTPAALRTEPRRHNQPDTRREDYWRRDNRERDYRDRDNRDGRSRGYNRFYSDDVHSRSRGPSYR